MKVLTPKRYLLFLFLSMLMLGCTMADDLMMKTFVKRFNKKCPIVTESISIDGAEVISKDTVAIYISFAYNLDESEIHFQKQILPATMTAPLLQMMKEKEYKLMKRKNINFLFGFYTNTGTHVTDITITPEQYNLPTGNLTEESESLESIGVLQHTANMIKQQLPIEIPATGITTVDCFVEDSTTLVTIFIIPNRFKEAVIDQIDTPDFKNLFYMELSQNPAVRNSISGGTKIKQSYILESGDTLMTLFMDKANIDTDFSKLIDIKTRIKYSIAATKHNINQEIMNGAEKVDEIYYTDCYFKNNTLTIELKVPEEVLENDYFDTYIIYNNILEGALNDELFTRFLLKKGVELEYIYKKQDDNILDTLTVTEKDVAKYKKNKFDNYEILKY